ncbi:hypothetical protein LXA43DRAFT_1186987 [Ganoderma leucocontextum]|nr:hypothetical protein LXA43DRAFT_1186987 [Ganoderma leucocontextum]
MAVSLAHEPLSLHNAILHINASSVAGRGCPGRPMSSLQGPPGLLERLRGGMRAQHAPSSTESFSPWLPPELVSRILTKLWEAPQTPQERSALLKNTTLVNRTWLTLVALITSRDVHISSKRNAHTFLRLLSKTSPIPKADDLFTTERTRFANDACRSVTFRVVDGTLSKWPSPLTKEIVAALIMRDPWPSPADDADDAISLVLD